MSATKIFMILAAAFGLGAATVSAQLQNASEGADLSRSMRVAVRFYEQGEDMQAMDWFMDILTKGDPSERAMANEYLNLISQRMNTTGGASGNPAARPGATRSERVAPAGAARPPSGATITEGPAAAKARPRARGDDMPAANKALMHKEIRARLRSAVESSLSDLKSIEGVRAVMRENGDPDALGIPANLLFEAGIAFQRDASRILDPLTKLIFALGATSAVILPEGTAIGDAKVMDMRRTMGISSHLFNAGVAPPRIRVNLLNTQVDVPRGLQDFKGVVIVFVYNRPLSLVVESAVGDELGPPISLGVYPPTFRPSRGQGVIVEFSVSDPPVGLVSWKFSLKEPSRDGSELAPLQEVIGGGPVFHQIFWNGKQNYFGEVLPAGRYECILTAIDAKNRRRALHRWISVLDDDGAGERLLAQTRVTAPVAPAAPAAPAAPVAPMRAPSADLGDAREPVRPLVAGVKAALQAVEIAPRSKAASGKRHVVKRPVRGQKGGKADKGKAAKASEPKPAAETSWELAFNLGTYQLTSAAEKLLAEVAAAVPAHPLENLRVTGHAAIAETDGAVLAGQRAKMVAGLLVNRYQVDSKRIFMNSAVSGTGPKVDLEFARTE